MLKYPKKTTVMQQVNVLQLLPQGNGNTRPSSFPCKACGSHIDLGNWAIAWVEEDGKEFSMRLCHRCKDKAQED